MARIRFLDDMLGEHFLAIEAAVKALKRPDMDLSRYTIAVAREEDTTLVVFLDNAENADGRTNLAVRRDGKGEPQADDGAAASAKLGEIESLDRVAGEYFRAASVAAGVFLKKLAVDLANYKIEIVGEGDSLVAIFTDKDQELGTVGHSKKCPGFEVEMRAKDLAVLRANFLR